MRNVFNLILYSAFVIVLAACGGSSNRLDLSTADSISDALNLSRFLGSPPANYSVGTAALSMGPSGPQVLYRGFSESHGLELFSFDLQSQETRLVKDVFSGSASSQPRSFVSLSDGRVLFIATDPEFGTSLWITNGSTAGSRRISNFGEYDNSISVGSVLKDSDRVLFFVEEASSEMSSLWIFDGASDQLSQIPSVLLSSQQRSATERLQTSSGGYLYILTPASSQTWHWNRLSQTGQDLEYVFSTDSFEASDHWEFTDQYAFQRRKDSSVYRTSFASGVSELFLENSLQIKVAENELYSIKKGVPGCFYIQSFDGGTLRFQQEVCGAPPKILESQAGGNILVEFQGDLWIFNAQAADFFLVEQASSSFDFHLRSTEIFKYGNAVLFSKRQKGVSVTRVLTNTSGVRAVRTVSTNPLESFYPIGQLEEPWIYGILTHVNAKARVARVHFQTGEFQRLESIDLGERGTQPKLLGRVEDRSFSFFRVPMSNSAAETQIALIQSDGTEEGTRILARFPSSYSFLDFESGLVELNARRFFKVRGNSQRDHLIFELHPASGQISLIASFSISNRSNGWLLAQEALNRLLVDLGSELWSILIPDSDLSKPLHRTQISSERLDPAGFRKLSSNWFSLGNSLYHMDSSMSSPQFFDESELSIRQVLESGDGDLWVLSSDTLSTQIARVDLSSQRLLVKETMPGSFFSPFSKIIDSKLWLQRGSPNRELFSYDLQTAEVTQEFNGLSQLAGFETESAQMLSVGYSDPSVGTVREIWMYRPSLRSFEKVAVLPHSKMSVGKLYEINGSLLIQIRHSPPISEISFWRFEDSRRNSIKRIFNRSQSSFSRIENVEGFSDHLQVWGEVPGYGSNLFRLSF